MKTMDLKIFTFIMALFVAFPIILACIPISVRLAEARDWEAKVPPGAETNPIALNIAYGEENIPTAAPWNP